MSSIYRTISPDKTSLSKIWSGFKTKLSSLFTGNHKSVNSFLRTVNRIIKTTYTFQSDGRFSWSSKVNTSWPQVLWDVSRHAVSPYLVKNAREASVVSWLTNDSVFVIVLRKGWLCSIDFQLVTRQLGENSCRKYDLDMASVWKKTTCLSDKVTWLFEIQII